MFVKEDLDSLNESIDRIGKLVSKDGLIISKYHNELGFELLDIASKLMTVSGRIKINDEIRDDNKSVDKYTDNVFVIYYDSNDGSGRVLYSTPNDILSIEEICQLENRRKKELKSEWVMITHWYLVHKGLDTKNKSKGKKPKLSKTKLSKDKKKEKNKKE